MEKSDGKTLLLWEAVVLGKEFLRVWGRPY